MASVPVVAIIVPIFERSLLKRWRTARNAYSRFVGWLAEAINGSKTIKTLSIEDEVGAEAKDITDDIEKKRWRAGRMNAFFQPLVNVISSLMIAVIVAVGLHELVGVRVIVDDRGHRQNELDDAFRVFVARGGFGAEDIGMRRHLESGWILLQFLVEIHACSLIP